MKTGLIWFMAIIISAFVICGCSPKAKYDRKLKLELASGVRYDSLFMGIYFGMPEKEFYLHCWKLNQKGLIKQGESNATVLYELKNELRYPATMDFYPKFSEGRIYELPVRFKYKGWAPWNKNLTSDKLQLNVLNWYKKVYGGGFIEVRHPQWGAAYVKINGNRRISIFKENELYVWAVFTDMSIKKNWNNSVFNPGNVQNDTIKNFTK
jgi:hypothetical protein